MSQESPKNNAVLIIIAVLGVVGTIVASAIGAISNYNIEKLRQDSEMTRVALVSMVTQSVATQNVMVNTANALTPSAPTSTEVIQQIPPTHTPTSISLPTPLPVNYEGLTNVDGFIFTVTNIDIRPNGKMRWNISFWNKSKNDYNIRFTLDNCAYISNRDDGARYPVEQSNYISDKVVGVQTQTRLDLWFDFEDVISKGARRFTVGLCPVPYASALFDPFDVDINP